MKAKKELSVTNMISNSDRLFLESNEGVLLCPQCGFDYVHIKKSIFAKSDIGDFNLLRNKIEIVHEPRDVGGYDYKITLQYTCENGHSGLITIWHHEGVTTVSHKPLKRKQK